MMDELPNPELDVRPKPFFNNTPHCHPKCAWDCGDESSCNVGCRAVCKPPICRTDCGKPDLSKCVRRCHDPQCAVVCPQTLCQHGKCPECETVCGKPNCTMDCGHATHCQSVCQVPSCAFQCDKSSCPQPECKLRCEPPVQGCLTRGSDVNLHDIYAGHGPLIDGVTAAYAGQEVAWTGLAKPVGPLMGAGFPEAVSMPPAVAPPPAVNPPVGAVCVGCEPAPGPAPCNELCTGCAGAAPGPSPCSPAQLSFPNPVQHAPIPDWLTQAPTQAPLSEDMIMPGGKMLEAR